MMGWMTNHRLSVSQHIWKSVYIQYETAFEVYVNKIHLFYVQQFHVLITRTTVVLQHYMFQLGVYIIFVPVWNSINTSQLVNMYTECSVVTVTNTDTYSFHISLSVDGFLMNSDIIHCILMKLMPQHGRASIA